MLLGTVGAFEELLERLFWPFVMLPLVAVGSVNVEVFVFASIVPVQVSVLEKAAWVFVVIRGTVTMTATAEQNSLTPLSRRINRDFFAELDSSITSKRGSGAFR
jgi:hypothetical protein